MATNPDTLRYLIAGGENETTEFKLNPPRLSELADRVCGFANSSQGGKLVIGVEDKTWEIKGLSNIPPVVDDLLKAARMCNPPVHYAEGSPEVVDLDGQKVVLAVVPPNQGLLYQSSGVFWLRTGTNTIPMQAGQVSEYLHRQGQLSWETWPSVRATMEDLDERKIDSYLEYLSKVVGRPSRAGSSEDLLVLQECASRTRDEATGQEVLRPTNAGLLLFGQAPRYFYPQAEIVCTYYQDDSGVRRYDDRRIISGTLTEQIDQAMAFLRLYTPVAAHIEGFSRIEEPAIPLEVLREAVVNAVIHRDYSLKGEAIRIFYYSDRVEIHNPGLLMPGLTIEDLKTGRTRSKPRNPVMASILRDMPGSYMERVGTGIPFMLNVMAHNGLPTPEFNQHGEFVVTLWNNHPRSNSATAHPAVNPGYQSEQPAAVPVEPSGKIGWDLPPSTGQDISAIGVREDRERRLRLALEHVRKHGFITNKQYQQLTGVSENTATRDLEILVAQGSLNKTGKGPSRRYGL
ncbi:MAG TPA: ATP-binding protein [Chloroflexia bacterium]|nr:ATP-binding protein [Chloroflexia bacterium]